VKDSPVMIILLALLAVAGTLGGVWLGRYLERDNEALKWRRDHALEVYSEFIRAIEVAHAGSDLMYISEVCGMEGHHKQAEVLLQNMLDMDRISQRLFLLAPDVVNARMSDLTEHMRKEIITKAMTRPKIEKGERDSAMKKSAELLAIFRNAARNDLGVHPPRYSAEEWTKIVVADKPWWRFW
jgi:hypothetical protein